MCRLEEQESQKIGHIYDYLKELHGKGVYKRLHINFECFNQRTLDGMPPLKALKSLYLKYDVDNALRDQNHHITPPKWLNLTELNVSCCFRSLNMDAMAHQLVNLRRIYFCCVDLISLVPFIRYSVYLTKVKIKHFSPDDDKQIYIHVATLNKERERLKGARRTSIFIQEDIYLQAKWELNGMENNLIDIRRASSDEWRHQYGTQIY